jgi:hypothetical protein
MVGDTVYTVQSVLSSQSSEIAYGPALSVLSLLKPRSCMSGGF